MTRHLAPARFEFGVANLRNSALVRAIRALVSNRANATGSAQTYSEGPRDTADTVPPS